MILIGWCGIAGSGKDEAGNVCQKYGFIKKCFSDTLKKHLIAHFLVPYKINYKHKNLYGSQEDKEEPIVLTSPLFEMPKWFIEYAARYSYVSDGNIIFNIRSLMQYYGTDLYRNKYGEDYWIDRTFNNLSPDGLYYNSSVRFINEANAIKKLGGYLIKIIRPNAPYISNMGHKSETEIKLIKNVDYIINNNGTLVEFQLKCEEVIRNCLRNT